jgi:hypothetical protein
MVDYRGMTTNERLFAANLLEEWDEATRNRDRVKMIELLSRVELTSQAEWIADTLLADPSYPAAGNDWRL